MTVHEIDVRLRIEQTLGLVLPVNVGDERRQLAQHADGHQRPVDGGASLSRRVHLPAHHDLVVLGGQPVTLQGRPCIAALDQRLHDREVFPGPDEVRGGARRREAGPAHR